MTGRPAWQELGVVALLALAGAAATAVCAWSLAHGDDESAVIAGGIAQFMFALAVVISLSGSIMAGPLLDGYDGGDLTAVLVGSGGCLALIWAATTRLVRQVRSRNISREYR